jgi:NAD(P)-dependent dehydrogenase (short-subunit alcohol dehydrogenase family)
LGGTAEAHPADLTDFEQTRSLVEKTVDAFGAIDILVNNAGMSQVGDPEAIIHMADLIAFLASDEATYITGQVLVVDGGNTIQDYKGPRDGYY